MSRFARGDLHELLPRDIHDLLPTDGGARYGGGSLARGRRAGGPISAPQAEKILSPKTQFGLKLDQKLPKLVSTRSVGRQQMDCSAPACCSTSPRCDAAAAAAAAAAAEPAGRLHVVSVSPDLATLDPLHIIGKTYVHLAIAARKDGAAAHPSAAERRLTVTPWRAWRVQKRRIACSFERITSGRQYQMCPESRVMHNGTLDHVGSHCYVSVCEHPL